MRRVQALKVLTVHRPSDSDRDFFQWEVDGELIVIPGAGRGTGDVHTAMCVVRELDVSPDDMFACCLFSLQESGWDDESFGEPLEAIAHETATDAIEAAAEHPVGTLLRLVENCSDGGKWCYQLGELSEFGEP